MFARLFLHCFDVVRLHGIFFFSCYDFSEKCTQKASRKLKLHEMTQMKIRMMWRMRNGMSIL